MYQAKITECDREIEAQLERFEDRSDGVPPAPNGKKRNQKNAPRFDVQGQLYRMTGGGPDPDRRRGCVHGPEGDQRDWRRHDQMAQRQALRVVAGAEPEQPHHRRQGHQLKDQAQRQPGRRGPASGGQRAAPLRQRPGRLPAPEESPPGSAPRPLPPRPTSWPGSSTPCCATARNTWMLVRNTTNVDITSGRCAPPSVGRRNWATNWCPCPTPGTAPRTHLPARQSPRDNVG